MKQDRHKTRLNAIKTIIPLFYAKCKCCGEKFRFERMFKVGRWGFDHSCTNDYYCQHCMPTKESVLHEVDTDEHSLGLFWIDDYIGYVKTDETRMRKYDEELLKIMLGQPLDGIKEIKDE